MTTKIITLHNVSQRCRLRTISMPVYWANDCGLNSLYIRRMIGLDSFKMNKFIMIQPRAQIYGLQIIAESLFNEISLFQKMDHCRENV